LYFAIAVGVHFSNSNSDAVAENIKKLMVAVRFEHIVAEKLCLIG